MRALIILSSDPKDPSQSDRRVRIKPRLKELLWHEERVGGWCALSSKGPEQAATHACLGQARNFEREQEAACLWNKNVRGVHWHCLFVTASVLGSRCWHRDLRVLLSCCPILHGLDRGRKDCFKMTQFVTNSLANSNSDEPPTIFSVFN